MKIAILFSLLSLSQLGFAADKIICDDEGSSVTYEISELKDFGILPDGLTPELAARVANSVCDFPGVYQESWKATCFEKNSIEGLTSGGYISGLWLAGFEHGNLVATDVKEWDCEGQ